MPTGRAGARVQDAERDDRHPLHVGVPEHEYAGVPRPRVERALREVFLEFPDRGGAHRLLEREDAAGAHRLDDSGRATLLAVDGVGVVGMVLRCDVGDRAATR
jgi:hypothetical protein